MQDGALATNGDVQSIYGSNGKDVEHRSSGGGLKTRRRKKGVTIPNNPECLYRPMGTECRNFPKESWLVLEEEEDNYETMEEGG